VPKSDKRFGLIVIASCCAGHASAADALLSFSNDSLKASYVATDANNGVFTGRAVDQPLLRTVGNFDRAIVSVGNADFGAGFTSLPGPADIVFTTTFVRTGVDTGSSVGTLVITDFDGDRFEAGIVGTWNLLGSGFFYLNWSMINPQIISDDGIFNGQNGSWSVAGLQLLSEQPAQPQIMLSGQTFFESSFNDVAFGISGQLIPTSGVVVVLVLGMAGLRARRSRRSV